MHKQLLGHSIPFLRHEMYQITQSAGTKKIYQTLLAEKYTLEYKIDRETRSKADHILSEYYSVNIDELNVS